MPRFRKDKYGVRTGCLTYDLLITCAVVMLDKGKLLYSLTRKQIDLLVVRCIDPCDLWKSLASFLKHPGGTMI